MKDIKDWFKQYDETFYSQPPVDNDQKMETLLKSLSLPALTEDQIKALITLITRKTWL